MESKRVIPCKITRKGIRKCPKLQGENLSLPPIRLAKQWISEWAFWNPDVQWLECVMFWAILIIKLLSTNRFLLCQHLLHEVLWISLFISHFFCLCFKSKTFHLKLNKKSHMPLTFLLTIHLGKTTKQISVSIKPFFFPSTGLTKWGIIYYLYSYPLHTELSLGRRWDKEQTTCDRCCSYSLMHSGKVLRFCHGESGMWKIERRETIMVFWGGEIVYVKHAVSNKSSYKLLHQGRQTTGTQLFILHLHSWLCPLHKPATGPCCSQHCVWIQITERWSIEGLKSKNYGETVRKNVFSLMQNTMQLIKKKEM